MNQFRTGTFLSAGLFVVLAAVALGLDESPLRTTPLPDVPVTIWEPDQKPLNNLGQPPANQQVERTSFDSLATSTLDRVSGYPVVEPLNCWCWQVVPEGLLYRPYLAGVREPRIGIQLFHESKWGWLWDGSIGGRVGVLRYGTTDPIWPEGWQLDVEAGAFPRLSADNDGDLISADYRYGFAVTHRRGRLESKYAFYHLSSHLGDEYMLSHPGVERINYSRFALVFGAAFYPLDNVRAYGEIDYGFYTDGGNRPWGLQFGIDYSPLNPSGLRGAPFFAVNGHLRQEVNYGGNFTLQTGWQWRGTTGRLARIGFYYFNGQSDQYEFFNEHEQQVGFGCWYDF